MAAAIWIVRHLPDPTRAVINGIETVFVNEDDADPEATVLAATLATLVAAGHPLGTGYFDSAVLALTAMSTDEDLVASGKRIELIA